jgi:hypothetical protein
LKIRCTSCGGLTDETPTSWTDNQVDSSAPTSPCPTRTCYFKHIVVFTKRRNKLTMTPDRPLPTVPYTACSHHANRCAIIKETSVSGHRTSYSPPRCAQSIPPPAITLPKRPVICVPVRTASPTKTRGGRRRSKPDSSVNHTPPGPIICPV